jgi:hypothetical protein
MTAERSTLSIKKSLPKQALHICIIAKRETSARFNTNMLINNEFNKLQINETIEKDGDGNVFKRSLMFNIRCNDVEEAEKLYQQLKAKFNGSTNAKAVTAAKDSNVQMCECGKPMVLRQGRSGVFYGCSSFPRCRKTREAAETTAEEIVDIQAEEAVPAF